MKPSEGICHSIHYWIFSYCLISHDNSLLRSCCSWSRHQSIVPALGRAGSSRLPGKPFSTTLPHGVFFEGRCFLNVLCLPIKLLTCSQLSCPGLDTGQCLKWQCGTWLVTETAEATKVSETQRQKTPKIPAACDLQVPWGLWQVSLNRYIHPICKNKQGT